MNILAHMANGRINGFFPLDRIIGARLRANNDCGAYGFDLEIWSDCDVQSDYRYFDTRDERQAAILAMCEASEREGFALTIS